jgi:CheY-like chemotaxis protein
MTANAYKEDIQNTKNAGMNAHISKPIDTKILLSILSELYAGSGDKE